MKKSAAKFLQLLFSFVLCLGMVRIPVAAAVRLENTADQFTVDAPDSENGNGPDHLTDGDKSTLWVRNSGTWPTTLTFAQPAGKSLRVKTVKVYFESGHSSWSVDVSLSYILNSVMDSPNTVKTTTDHGFDDVFEYTFESAIDLSHLQITLDNPKNNGSAAGFWPALAEVEIYTEADEEDVNLVNVAGNSVITSIGGNSTAALVDEDENSLFTLFNGTMDKLPAGQNAWFEMELDKAYDTMAFEAVFEKTDPDAYNFEFIFDVYGKAEGASDWSLLFENQSATRLSGGNTRRMELKEAASLKAVRFELKEIRKTGGSPWPAIAEFRVLALPEAVEVDANPATGKPAHANAGAASLKNINDGNLNSVWNAESYPAYVDIDLEENYFLDDITIHTPASGYQQYTIYTSMDGGNFTRAARKMSEESCPAEGETYELKGTEARFVRLYMEYNSASEKAQVSEVLVSGKPSNTPLQQAKEVVVEDFDDSKYNVEITAADTYEEVYGIISRRIGQQYVSWFELELKDTESESDFYELSAKDGKVLVSGNNGVSLATGVNEYLKRFCNVHISQVGDQVKMPEAIILPTETVHKETKYPVRYSYNYCTLSYSMAFWSEEEWRNELDWLALNGVNLVLDATGQEEVWRRFLGKCGYTHQEIKDFIAGPAYYAWFYMANLSGFGGPVSDSWFEERTELARNNHLIMRKLGMQPVLQGYCGMVPVDFTDKQPDAKVIAQGKWCSFQRPYMLKTDDECFDQYAALFYECQKEVYGDVCDYYATDPFHEGGNTGGMDESKIAENTLAAMMKADEDAVWVIQSWQGNPTTKLLSGLAGNRDHALVLDLYAERNPNWSNPSYGGSIEFQSTPWVYCMLNNFGGRLGLYGLLDNLATELPKAAASATVMQGIGIAPEASQNNPVLYDFLFDTLWSEDGDIHEVDLDQWLEDYAHRRYGAVSDSANAAWQILKDTVYSSKCNPDSSVGGQQGAPENVANARPALSISSASTWGFSQIRYEKEDLEEALALLLEDFDLLKDSDGYLYDVVSVAQQVLSNTAQELHKKMSAAFQNGEADKFDLYSESFLNLLSLSDQLLSTQPAYLLGTWTQAAAKLAENSDDFTKDLYDLNAKALITTWGSINQCNSGGLKDYSNRQWAGLTNDYYRERWAMWIAERKKELAGEEYKNFSNADWFAWEWKWARDKKEYSNVPAQLDIEELCAQVLEAYSVTNLPKDPAEDDSFDLTATPVITAGSEQDGDYAVNAYDGNANTLWHTLWAGDDADKMWIEFAYDKPVMVEGLRYLPRSGAGNGTITSYQVLVWNEETQNWDIASEGNWSRSDGWKMTSFDAVETTKVRLFAVASHTDSGKRFASAAEIRIIGSEIEEEIDLSVLEAVIAAANAINADDYDQDGAWTSFQEALAAANAVLANPESQEAVDAVAAALQDAIDALNVKTPEANKTLLAQAVAYAQALKDANALEGVNSLVAEKFNAALENAETVLGDPKASQEAVNAAWMELSAAIQMLDFKTDKTELAAVIAMAEALDLDAYEEAGKAEFAAALAYAKDVYADDAVLTEGSIQAAIDRLNAAMEALVLKAVVDTTMLEFVTETFKEVDLSLYLAKDQEEFVAAYEDAMRILANPASQAEVDAALLRLNRAWLNLRLAPSEDLLKQLQEFQTAAASLNRTAYRAETLAKIDALAEEVNAALANPELTLAQAQEIAARIDEVNALIASPDAAEEVITPSISEETITESIEPSVSTTDKAVSVSTANSVKTGLIVLPFALMAAGAAMLLVVFKRKSAENK